MKKLSVIVSVLESHEVVRRQLLHFNRILSSECELVLVDDGSVPPLRDTCDSVDKNFDFLLHCTRDRRPWTQPRGRNIGASLAQADKLLFFDIDHILTQDIVTTCLGYDGDKLHWFRRPAVLDEQGEIITDLEILAEYGLTDGAPSVHGNSFMIRRELVKAVGLLDERFGVRCFEDDDYCRRALQAGYRVVIARDAFVHHYGGRTFVGSGIDFGALMRENLRVYETKWRAPEPDVRASQRTDPVRVADRAEIAYTARVARGGGLLLVPKQVGLSLCMIVRDNARTIVAAIESAKPWVDEIIVIDTGSVDDGNCQTTRRPGLSLPLVRQLCGGAERIAEARPG